MSDRALPRALVVLFFAALLAVGLLVYRDYGASWDEGYDREVGQFVYDVVTFQRGDLGTYWQRFYGPLYDFVVFLVTEKILRIEDSRELGFARHLAYFLTFFASAIFLYALAKERFASRGLGLLAALLLVANPLVFAHAFFNPKDVPIFLPFIASFYTLTRLLDDWTPRRALAHGLAMGALLAMRVTGALLPALTVAFAAAQLASRRPPAPRGRIVRLLLRSLLVMALVTIACWPTLWLNPVGRFLEAWKTMSRYEWPFTVLYMGRQIEAMDPPWHYAPVWVALTTPPVQLIAFVLGCATCAVALWKKPTRPAREHDPLASAPLPLSRDRLLFLLWFFVPFGSVIVLRSTQFNSWRHLFFVYPALVLIAVCGLHDVCAALRRRPSAGWRALLAGIVLASAGGVVSTLLWMGRHHGLEHLYFTLPTSRVLESFELDYWGVTYRKGLEYVARTDPAESIRVCASESTPLQLNLALLEARDRRRLVEEPSKTVADYFISTRRGPQPDGAGTGREVFSVRFEGVPILTVWKRAP